MTMQWVIVGVFNPNLQQEHILLHEIYFNRIFDTKMIFNEIVDYKK